MRINYCLKRPSGDIALVCFVDLDKYILKKIPVDKRYDFIKRSVVEHMKLMAEEHCLGILLDDSFQYHGGYHRVRFPLHTICSPDYMDNADKDRGKCDKYISGEYL